MATDQEQPDDLDDDRLARLLKRASSAPEPRDEFVRALSDRLDAEFSAIGKRRSLVEKLQAPPSNGNGAAAHAATNGHVALKSIATAANSPIVKRSWRRWTMMAAAAASLFVAVIVWGPAYGWTVAIRTWVIGLVQLSTQTATSGDNGAAPTASPVAQSAAPLVVAEPQRENVVVVPGAAPPQTHGPVGAPRRSFRTRRSNLREPGSLHKG